MFYGSTKQMYELYMLARIDKYFDPIIATLNIHAVRINVAFLLQLKFP